MTWTPDSIETWRDSSVLFGHNFETNHYIDRYSIHARRDMSVLFGQIFLTTRYFDRDSIHARRDMSFIFGLIIKSFTVMTWTPHLTHGWRDMSVIIGHNFETNAFFDRDSIESWRDLSVEMPPGYEVIHGNDLDTGLDSHQPGYELHIRAGYEAIHGDDLNLTHDWRDMSFKRRLMKAVVHQRSRR